MSTNRTEPRRPSPAVYRRRRLMVLLGLIGVVIAVVLIVVRPGSSEGSEPPATTGTGATPSAGEAQGETPAPSAPATDAPASALPTEAPEEPVEGARCTKTQVRVEAVTDRTQYDAGVQPNLTLTVTNIGPNACVINAGTKAQAFVITSGSEEYWVSTHCQSNPVDADVTLAPDVPVSSAVPIIWDRTRSAPDTCGIARETVPAGGASYHLSVSIDGFESAETKQFLLY